MLSAAVDVSAETIASAPIIGEQIERTTGSRESLGVRHSRGANMGQPKHDGRISSRRYLLFDQFEAAGGCGDDPVLVDWKTNSELPLTVRICEFVTQRRGDLDTRSRQRAAGVVDDLPGTFAQLGPFAHSDAFADCADW